MKKQNEVFTDPLDLLPVGDAQVITHAPVLMGETTCNQSQQQLMSPIHQYLATEGIVGKVFTLRGRLTARSQIPRATLVPRRLQRRRPLWRLQAQLPHRLSALQMGGAGVSESGRKR